MKMTMPETVRHISFVPSAEFSAAREVAAKIQQAGFPAMLVGGCVRDLLNGVRPADFDLVTVAQPEELAALFPGCCRMIGACFGVSLLRYGAYEFEVATAREERNYLDGRHPESVRYTADLARDMERRDFTINALRYDPVSEILYDSVGGLEDLERGVIRTVGVAEERFSEDYLRMLRAVRFAARFRFEIAPETWRAIGALSGNCTRLAGERLYEELTRMLTGSDPARALELLRESGILKAVLPEVAALYGVEQPKEFHPEGDVWTHTLRMFEHQASADANLSWSVLLHDIGKAPSQSVDSDGRIRFFGHETIGAEMACAIAERFRFSNADRDAIVQAIRNHMRFASVREMRPGKIRRLLADPNFPLELELHRLDCISCHGMLEGFVYLLDCLRARSEHELPEMWVTGKKLIACGCRPGPAFKEVLERTYEEQLNGNLAAEEEALRFALEFFSNSDGKNLPPRA